MFCPEKTIALVKRHSGEFCGGNAAISAKAKDFANFCRPAAQQLLRQAAETALVGLLALKPGNPD
jgi:hypothetical protein